MKFKIKLLLEDLCPSPVFMSIADLCPSTVARWLEFRVELFCGKDLHDFLDFWHLT